MTKQTNATPTLPTKKNGKVNWDKVFLVENIGRKFATDRTNARNAYDRAQALNWWCKTTRNGKKFWVTVMGEGRRPDKEAGPDKRDIINRAAIADNDHVAKLKEAKEILAKWEEVARLGGKGDPFYDKYMARVLAWRMQVDYRERMIALNAG